MGAKKILPLALVAGLVVAACGDDDGGDAGEQDGTQATADATATTAADGTTATTGTTASAGTSAPPETGEASCDATVPGSELTISVFASTGQLDPTLVAGGVVGGTEIAALYDELFTYDYDTNEVVPHLAEGITWNDDFTEFTLTLRDGITFSDGTPLDAQMVADNIDRYFADGATAPHGTFLAFIEEKEVVDPLTLRLTMSRPWAEFPSFFAEQPGMIVNTNVTGDDLQAFANDPPDAAGVGPYVLERNVPGEEIVFTAREDYWGGPVCVETLRVVSIPGAIPTYDAFQNGEIDVAFFRDPTTIAEAQANGEEGFFVPVDIGTMLLVNLAEGHAANDDRLREALWLAIDPDVVNDRGYQGEYNVSQSLIHPDSVWGSDDLAVVEHDPERARQLVQDAEADGLTASITILANTIPPAPEVALAWQGMFENVGFEVSVEQAQVNDVVSQVFQLNFDSASWAYSMEPAQLTSRLWGAFHTDGTNNRGKYSNPEMDAALDEAMSAGPEDRAEAVKVINDIYVQDFVSPILGNNLDGIIWQENVSGVVVNPTDIYLFHDAVVDG